MAPLWTDITTTLVPMVYQSFAWLQGALPVCAGLSEVLRKHTYVGMADETLALLQHGTRLYLLNVATLSKDMFYQQVCILLCHYNPECLAMQHSRWHACKASVGSHVAALGIFGQVGGMLPS